MSPKKVMSCDLVLVGDTTDCATSKMRHTSITEQMMRARTSTDEPPIEFDRLTFLAPGCGAQAAMSGTSFALWFKELIRLTPTDYLTR
ncbi:hypothetical protein WL14_31035 [Burkholderia cepacia]|nr:hypothetical protein WL14_31035 [Burkholderia cepacia]